MNTPWIHRVWKEFSGRTLTRTFRDVLLRLHEYFGKAGLICPSHETLAERARCSVSTVKSALKQASRLGLVHWGERRVRVGWRWLRTSNQYWLTLPEGPVRPEMRPVWRRHTTVKSEPGGEKEVSKRAHKAEFAALVREAMGQPDLLAARRAAVEAQMLSKFATRPAHTPV